MASDAQEVTLQPAAWSDQAERWLSQALAGASLAQLRDQVEAGAALFHICSGDLVCGAVLLRVDHTAAGSEGVIVAGAASLAGVEMLDTVMPGIESLFRGVRRYRYHTARPALVRKLQRHGYVPREIVCFKECAT